MTKKVLAIVLTLAMVLTFASFPAFAEGPAKIEGITAQVNITLNDGTSVGPNSETTTADKMVDGITVDTYFQSAKAFYNSTKLDVLFDLGDYYTLSTMEYYGGTLYINDGSVFATNAGLDAADSEWVEIGGFTSDDEGYPSYLTATATFVEQEAYRYVKVRANSYNTTGSKIALREFIFTGVPGTAPEAGEGGEGGEGGEPSNVPVEITGVTATSNYTANGSYTIDKMLDGDRSNTYFQTSANFNDVANPDFEIVFDLGDTYNITHFSYYGTTKYMKAANIYGSNSTAADAEWTLIGSFTGASMSWATETIYRVADIDISHENYYQYIKVEAVTLSSAGQQGIREIIFTGIAGTPTDNEGGEGGEGEDIEIPSGVIMEIPGVTATSNHAANGSYTLDNMFDGDRTNTYFQTTTNFSDVTNPDFEIIFDLGDTFNITHFSYYGTTKYMKSANIYGSNSNGPDAEWTLIASFQGASMSWAAGTTYRITEFDISNEDFYRYIKMEAVELNSTGQQGIREITFTGMKGNPAEINKVLSAPDISLYAEGSTVIDFPFTVATVDNVDPIAYFDVANWVLDNCEITVTTESVSAPASDYYIWDIDVKATPIDGTKPFAMDLDLPDSYMFTDGFSFYLEPSDLLFDSAIAAGQNAITLSKNAITLDYDSSGVITTTAANRTINVVIEIQSVLENKLPYEGYDEVVIELKEFKAKGDRVRYYLDEFVFVDNKYYASALVTKSGVDQFEAVIGIYGVNADGTKDLIDTRTVVSDLIDITAKYPAVQTEAQKVMSYTFPMDVLDQLVGYVHPSDLPTYSDDEWAYFKEILIARGWNADKAQTEIDRVRTLVETEKALLDDPNWVPTQEYATGTLYLTNRRTKVNAPGTYETVIRMGTTVWNMLVDMHFDNFALRGTVARPSAQYAAGFENDVDDVYVTFRRGIDFTGYEKFTEGNGFCMRVRLIASTDDYSKVSLGRAYNAIRRTLNDDQVSPIIIRYDWYNWAANPFDGGVITVRLTENWVENYGMFNLATYHMAGYKYADDGDADLTLIEEGLSIANPLTREVSIEFEGAAKFYDAYVIVGTEKIPSDEPEVNGTYFDVD